MKNILSSPVRTKMLFIIAVGTVLLFSSVYISETDFEYTIENGGITITGWKGNNSNVVIPAFIDGLPVRKIGASVFDLLKANQGKPTASHKRIQSVVMPESITEIGNTAFFYCDELTGVTLPKELEIIGNGAFEVCIKITEITFPAGLKKIGMSAFNRCNLSEVILPESVTEVGHHAFELNQISRVILPENLMEIGYKPFADNPLTSIKMPKNLILDNSDGVFGNADNYPNAFAIWYTATGSNAGLYTFENGVWHLEGKNLLYGTVLTEGGAFLSTVNGKMAMKEHKIGDGRYILPPGKHDIEVGYSLGGYVSTKGIHSNITVKSGKTYRLIAGRNQFNTLGWGFDIREE